MSKTIDEMIEVMTAFKNGKKIEQKDKGKNDWFYSPTPSWDWVFSDYRIKEEPKYRVYENTEEMIEDFCTRFGVTRTKFGEPFIWVKGKTTGKKYLIGKFDTVIAGVYFIGDLTMIDLFDNYTYLDGSPCGVEE